MKKKVEKNYIAMFDEHFIYFMKDEEVVKENSSLRRIGNKYSLKLIHNTVIEVYKS
jgi:hypothetical protein